MTRIVGLTGGIGSGKTTVAKMFEALGVSVYIADLQARKITNQPATLKLIVQEFGNAVVENEQLNRTVMAEIVFNNPEKLNQLNAIIHPLVAQDFKNWLSNNDTAVYILKETAILLETNNHISCDFVITVTAPQDLIINRVKNRDHISEIDVLKRINNQWSDESRIALSDFVIYNENRIDTLNQVKNIHKELIKLSQ